MPEFSRLVRSVGLVGWLALCFAVSGIGALASVQAAPFYAELARPGWAPPGWVFGPVWSVLYAMMGVAAWLVWRERGFRGAPFALGLFLAQLALNAAWSWLFFYGHLGGAAFVDILLLWALIVATIVTFRRVSPLGAVLLVPYLLWVTFAAALNLSIWRLNPGLL